MIWLKNCWVGVKQQSLTHSMLKSGRGIPVIEHFRIMNLIRFGKYIFEKIYIIRKLMKIFHPHQRKHQSISEFEHILRSLTTILMEAKLLKFWNHWRAYWAHKFLCAHFWNLVWYTFSMMQLPNVIKFIWSTPGELFNKTIIKVCRSNPGDTVLYNWSRSTMGVVQ